MIKSYDGQEGEMMNAYGGLSLMDGSSLQQADFVGALNNDQLTEMFADVVEFIANKLQAASGVELDGEKALALLRDVNNASKVKKMKKQPFSQEQRHLLGALNDRDLHEVIDVAQILGALNVYEDGFEGALAKKTVVKAPIQAKTRLVNKNNEVIKNKKLKGLKELITNTPSTLSQPTSKGFLPIFTAIKGSIDTKKFQAYKQGYPKMLMVLADHSQRLWEAVKYGRLYHDSYNSIHNFQGAGPISFPIGNASVELAKSIRLHFQVNGVGGTSTLQVEFALHYSLFDPILQLTYPSATTQKLVMNLMPKGEAKDGMQMFQGEMDILAHLVSAVDKWSESWLFAFTNVTGRLTVYAAPQGIEIEVKYDELLAPQTLA